MRASVYDERLSQRRDVRPGSHIVAQLEAGVVPGSTIAVGETNSLSKIRQDARDCRLVADIIFEELDNVAIYTTNGFKFCFRTEEGAVEAAQGFIAGLKFAEKIQS